MSTESTHFVTLMNNGKAFSSLDGMASSYQCYQTSFSFYQELTSQGIGFLETLKNPANLFKYNLNKTRNNMKSQIQKKKKKKEWWNCGITNTQYQHFSKKNFS